MARTTKAVSCLLLTVPIMLAICELANAGKPAPLPPPPRVIYDRFVPHAATADCGMLSMSGAQP